MPPPHHRHLRAYIALLIALIILSIVLFIFGRPFFVTPPAPQLPQQPATTVGFPSTAPAPTTTDYVTAQQGFQYLVSYTATGFRPTALTVKKGEIIRFSNNTDAALSLTIAGASYTVAPRAYYEYTASSSFTYSDGTQSGTATVN